MWIVIGITVVVFLSGWVWKKRLDKEDAKHVESDRLAVQTRRDVANAESRQREDARLLAIDEVEVQRQMNEEPKKSHKPHGGHHGRSV